MKLELKHLAPYLPCELRCAFYGEDSDGSEFYGITTITNIDIENEFVVADIHAVGNCEFTFNDFKPILRPLSDLTKRIEVNGEKFVPMNTLFNGCYKKGRELLPMPQIIRDTLNVSLGKTHFRHLEYWVIENLFEWHFDVFGLIDHGLAVDINTLNK